MTMSTLLALLVISTALSFVMQNDGTPLFSSLKIAQAPSEPEDAVNLSHLDDRLDNIQLPCLQPLWPTMASVSCPAEFSITQGGICSAACLSDTKPFPSVATIFCDASGWNGTVTCLDEATSCESAVALYGVGVYNIKNIGEIYCDGDGYGLFFSTEGSSSNAIRSYNPANKAASASFTLANMGIPTPENRSGQLQYSHVPAGTPVRMKCSRDSGSSWYNYDLPSGFADYSAGDKDKGTGIWGTIAISNVRSRHGNSICGPAVTSVKTYSGIGICNGNPTGWESVKATAWSTDSGEYIGCNGGTAMSTSAGRFMFLMKV